jgi:hypothetical protein
MKGDALRVTIKSFWHRWVVADDETSRRLDEAEQRLEAHRITVWCGCRRSCGDLPEEQDRPGATCRGLSQP